MLRELPRFMTEVYSRRIQGFSNATRFNMGGTGFFHQFYLWMLVRALKPKHIIETGAYNGLGTWQLRQAAPDAQIIVVSPETPHLYVDEKPDSRYFTAEHFRDFALIDWDCMPGLDRSQTLVFVDDHQSGYRRLLEAHARGFRHTIYDDNEMPAKSDHFSAKGACAAASGNLTGPIGWDDFRGIVADWGRWRRGSYFNVSAEQLEQVGKSFSKVIDVYTEMPPLWTAGLPSRSYAPKPLLNDMAGTLFTANHREHLRTFRQEAIAYGFFAYLRTKPLDSVPAGDLYYPPHVTTNGYSGILPMRPAGSCSRRNAKGASPTMLKRTRQSDDPRRNSGAGTHIRFGRKR